MRGRRLNRLTNGPYGAPSGIRTRDPLIKSQLLYQLSYRRILSIEKESMQRKLRPFSMLSLSQEGGAYLRLQNRTVKPQDLAHKRLHPSLTFRSSPRLISIGQLHTLPCFHLRPIYDIVYVEPYSFRMRDLILGGVSRLDAFSVYLVQT